MNLTVFFRIFVLFTLFLTSPVYAGIGAQANETLNFSVLKHPLIEHNLTIIRDKTTDSKNFRQAISRITLLMGYEITKNLKTTEKLIKTPICKAISQILGEKIVFVPVLRAGLGMLDSMLELVPEAAVGYIGVYRDHNTKQTVEYLCKLPPIHNQLFILLDPMLATGNSIIHAVKKLLDAGVSAKRIMVVTLIAAPEGVKKFQDIYPSIALFTASLDNKLDNNSYIVPGLGDAGDRLYGTK